MSERHNLRKKMNEFFKTNEDLDAFLIDHFGDAWKSMGTMNRQQKLNQLLERQEVAEIQRALLIHEGNVHSSDAMHLGESPEEVVNLRQEVTRLQQMIRDQELPCKGDISKPSISPQTGLNRLSGLKTALIELLSGENSATPHQWTSIGHTILDGLECSLGRFHNISCDFRYQFSVLKQPITNHYLELLNAAEKILKQKVAEDARGSAIYELAMPQEREPPI